MCQNGIDYRGLMLAMKQLEEREDKLKADIEAWADYFLEQGASDIAVELRNAVESQSKSLEYLSKVEHQLEHLHHDHHEDHDHSHHITITQFSEAD